MAQAFENPDTAPVVLIVDDDISMRRALERQIALLGYRVKGFTKPDEMLAWSENSEAECVILDLEMPGMNGLELQRELSLRGHEIPTLFLSGMVDVPTTVQAMQGGALNVLEKPVEAETLAQAIKSAVSRSKEIAGEQSRKAQNLSRFELLTDRQKSVFEGIVAGFPNKVIAHEMGITVRTVKAHRHQVMEKLKARSVADLAFIATNLGVSQDRVADRN